MGVVKSILSDDTKDLVDHFQHPMKKNQSEILTIMTQKTDFSTASLKELRSLFSPLETPEKIVETDEIEDLIDRISFIKLDAHNNDSGVISQRIISMDFGNCSVDV
ncbi:hypothetical protein SS50377_27205 [Spironucleus salmonicida]|uniref:Uncharacterized protein n=1 Tax=Spironucleus salmonicida TaxID=348837 RepID=V6LWF0_9EUKA|nr:hypothetical protein SS50377_27205 [Spironucleus salmonicida]|eukprot:EST48957.1 Hypothetical protein SS50377_10805 [Spironucleus salmonicida]